MGGFQNRAKLEILVAVLTNFVDKGGTTSCLDTLVRFPALKAVRENFITNSELDANLADPQAGENDKLLRERE